MNELLFSAFPVLGGRYWYLNAYLGTCLISPIINIAVINCTKKQLLVSAILGFSVFSVLGTLSIHDIFAVEYGYSVTWLCMLYYIGAVLRKYAASWKMNIRLAALFFFLCTFTLWGGKFMIESLCALSMGKAGYGNIFLEYTSPLVIGMAISLVIIFSNLKMNEKIGRAISVLSGNAFFVYIIHMHPVFLNAFILEKYAFIGKMNVLEGICYTLLISIFVFSSCLFIDYFLCKLECKFKIKKALRSLEEKYLGVVW